MPDEAVAEENAEVSAEAPAEKKKKKQKTPDEIKAGRKRVALLILIAIVLAAIWMFCFNNALGVRDNYIFPALRSVPVVKDLVPPEETEEDDEYSGKDREDVIEENKKLKSQIEKLEEDKANLQTAANDDKKEIARLKLFESEQTKFREEKRQFDETVAAGDTPEYKNYYESIYPENADAIYREILGSDAKEKNIKSYINTFENMKKDAAAKILEEMIGSDMDLVVDILKNLSDNQRSDILSAMKAENAASCAKRLAPDGL